MPCFSMTGLKMMKIKNTMKSMSTLMSRWLNKPSQHNKESGHHKIHTGLLASSACQCHWLQRLQLTREDCGWKPKVPSIYWLTVIDPSVFGDYKMTDSREEVDYGIEKMVSNEAHGYEEQGNEMIFGIEEVNVVDGV